MDVPPQTVLTLSLNNRLVSFGQMGDYRVKFASGAFNHLQLSQASWSILACSRKVFCFAVFFAFHSLR
jgi:hypothetical protein